MSDFMTIINILIAKTIVIASLFIVFLKSKRIDHNALVFKFFFFIIIQKNANTFFLLI
jgi:hypothetical protein